MQRATFVAVLSFLFFLAMMFGFYLRQNIGYFLLATAFLLIYLLTMFSWVYQRRSMVRIYKNGIRYRRIAVPWDEIASFSDRPPYEIRTRMGGKIVLPAALASPQEVAREFRRGIASSDS